MKNEELNENSTEEKCLQYIYKEAEKELQEERKSNVSREKFFV